MHPINNHEIFTNCRFEVFRHEQKQNWRRESRARQNKKRTWLFLTVCLTEAYHITSTSQKHHLQNACKTQQEHKLTKPVFSHHITSICTKNIIYKNTWIQQHNFDLRYLRPLHPSPAVCIFWRHPHTKNDLFGDFYCVSFISRCRWSPCVLWWVQT